jgi:hypothetical protein
MGVLKKKKRTRRPPLRKRTPAENERFRKEYSERMESYSRTTAPLSNTLEIIAGNGAPKICRSLHRFRPTLSEEENVREREAAAEAARKAKRIMPLYPKGAYQLITEGNKSALLDDSRGKRTDLA